MDLAILGIGISLEVERGNGDIRKSLWEDWGDSG